MGQYHLTVNLEKKEYLHPHKFGCGLKLVEFSQGIMMQGLVALLADNNGGGGGDFHASSPLIGSWAGDPIVVTGDYKAENTYPEEVVDGADSTQLNLYNSCEEAFVDRSLDIIEALASDEYFLETWANSLWSIAVFTSKELPRVRALLEKFPEIYKKFSLTLDAPPDPHEEFEDQVKEGDQVWVQWLSGDGLHDAGPGEVKILTKRYATVQLMYPEKVTTLEGEQRSGNLVRVPRRFAEDERVGIYRPRVRVL